MKLGLSTPVVMQVPGLASSWEADGTAADLALIATTADELGYKYLTCAEHVAVPAAEAVGRGDTYWDPAATLGFLAAHTSRIRLATSVLVLGYHHPLKIAKQYGTLDRLSGGRVVLGVGVGSLEAEFDLLGASFADRGARADDAMRALRAALGQREPSYAGEFFEFSGMSVNPWAQQGRMPMWVGGRTHRSLRRAVELGEGWMPFALASDEMRSMLESISLPTGFEVVLAAGRALDPGADPDGTRRALDALRHAGATSATCTVASRSAQHYCEQLAQLQELAS
ncbi:MAG: TIGR03619 family F420-dependent LLM class oxidoreductase [Mycobacterium sp.]